MIRLLIEFAEAKLAPLAQADTYIECALKEFWSIPKMLAGLDDKSSGHDIPPDQLRARIDEIRRQNLSMEQEATHPPSWKEKANKKEGENNVSFFEPTPIILANDSDSNDDISSSVLILIFFLFYLSLYLDYGIGYFLTHPIAALGDGWITTWLQMIVVSVLLMSVSLLGMAFSARQPYLSAIVGSVCLIASAQFIRQLELAAEFRGAMGLLWLFAVLLWWRLERHGHRKIMLFTALAIGIAIFYLVDGWQFIRTIDDMGKGSGVVMAYFAAGSGIVIMLGYGMHRFSIASSAKTSPSVAVALGVNSAAFIVWGGIAVLVFFLGKAIVVDGLKKLFVKSSE